MAGPGPQRVKVPVTLALRAAGPAGGLAGAGRRVSQVGD